jgi:hypothetical protein
MKDLKVNLSDVIKIVIFICGLLGTWYSMKYNVDALEEKVNRLETQLEETNLGVIKNDIEYIKEGQTDLKNGLQEYYKVVNDFIINHDNNH